MAYIVADRIEVSLYIDNQEFPLDSLNILNYLHIGWWTRGLLPTVNLSVFDARHTLDLVPLQDAIPLRITIKAYQGQTMTFNFRKFNHKKEFMGNGFSYIFDGYLDSPKYWSGTSLGGIQGTSNDALSQIASTCGLKYDGQSTNDSQIWMPRNRTYGEFAESISRRGYASSTSYMELAVTSDGVMRYKDVNSLPAPQTTIILGQFQQGALTAADYQPNAQSGLNNKMTGYQNTRYAQSMTGPTLSSANSTLQFTPDSRSPLFNDAMQAGVQRGYQSYGGIDVGNTHENYETAVYQNMRYANLYSLDVAFLLNTPSALQPLDTFTFSVDQEVNKTDVAYAGTYIVVGRAILVQGANYAEKILGTRHGTDVAYTSG
jgi:hypothetical protein